VIVRYVILSVCEQDNARTRERTSTIHSMHGQGMTLWKWLHLGVDPDVGVDL